MNELDPKTNGGFFDSMVGGFVVLGGIVGGLAFIMRHRITVVFLIGCALVFYSTVKMFGYLFDYEEKITFPTGSTPMALDTAAWFFAVGLCLMIIASLFYHPRPIKLPKADER